MAKDDDENESEIENDESAEEDLSPSDVKQKKGQNDPWRRRRRRRRHVVVVVKPTTTQKPTTQKPTTLKPTTSPPPRIPVYFWIPIIQYWKKNGVKIHTGIVGWARTLRKCCRKRGKCHGKWFCHII